jgi:hypothetical protein
LLVIKSTHMKTGGIILIIIGAVMMIITGINFKSEEKVLDLGKLEVNKEKSHPVMWSPIIGGILLAGGIILAVAGKKK